MQNIVSEHEQYLDSLRDFNDWLISAKEELQRWSDLSGDSVSIRRKLQKVQVRNCHMSGTELNGVISVCFELMSNPSFQELLDSKQRGRERLSRVQRCGAVARDHTGSGGYEAMEREEAALVSAWEQWERGALQTRASLETTLSQIASSEQEFSSRSVQLEQELSAFGRQLQECRVQLSQAEGKNDGEEAVKGWQLAKVGLILFPFKVTIGWAQAA